MAFDALAADWRCPVCGASKEAFVPADQADVHAGASSTVSDVIVSELERWGVTFVLGLPGTSSLGIFEAIRKRPSIRLIVVRDEATAAFAASAYNKLTDKVAACLTIEGPGATNLTTGLYDAQEDHAAVLSINGQVEMQYAGPGGIQEIDQDAFFRPLTVYSNTIYDKNLTVKLVTRALKHAIIRRGVAQLSVPNNIQKEPLDAACCPRESAISTFDIAPPETEIDRAVALIHQAQRPVIVAGWGARDSAETVLAIAERIKAPIVITFRAKGIFTEDHSWVMGILGGVGSVQARTFVQESDLLITFGVGFSKLTMIPEDKPMVQVDIDPLKLGKIPFTVALWGSCACVLPKLLGRLREREDPATAARLAASKKEWDEQRDREADSAAVPLRPPFIMKVLEETIPEDAVIALDIGDNMWWFGRNFRMKKQKMVMSGYLGSMGAGLPAAIAAKVAYPDKTVICISGDGGFSQAMGDFVTTVKYQLPMVVVVLSNNQLAMIQVEQKMENYENFATDLLNPDFAAYAQACGGEGYRVARPDELRPAIVAAIHGNRPTIIDIDTAPGRFW